MERLGMLRGVRMASVGAFVLIGHMLRLICGRRFVLITVAMAIVVAYQLTDDLFISYGTVGADSLLGVDLPPLFMAAMTMGGSEAFALLLPLALLADSTWSFKNGHLSLLVAKGVDPVRLSLSCMAALMIATGYLAQGNRRFLSWGGCARWCRFHRIAWSGRRPYGAERHRQDDAHQRARRAAVSPARRGVHMRRAIRRAEACALRHHVRAPAV